MRSFRLKTVFLTVALSSVLLLSSGVIGWRWLSQEFQDALDARIVLPGQRIAEYHGWASDWEQFASTIDTLIGEGWKQNRILKLRSNMYKRGTLFQSENWPEDFPFQDLPRFEELMQATSMKMRDENSSYIRYTLLDSPHTYTATIQGRQWRMATISNTELTLYIGIDLGSYNARLFRLRIYYFGALFLVILLIGTGAYAIANRALKPVNAIAQTAKRITSKDLEQRIESSREFDREFDSLIAVVNEMLNRLETSVKQAMRFSSDASHELKTPLTIIQSEIASQLQNDQLDSSDKQNLKRLLDEVERLRRIIQNLFLLSQADAGTMPLSPERYDLSKQLESFTQDAEILGAELGLKIESSIQSGIEVYADRLMLGQVFHNLISNGIKYNEAQGFLKWRLLSKENSLIFSIENSGVPIPEAIREKIFDRFFRGHQNSFQNSSGLGLGLSLAREIVIAHQGTIELVKSDPYSTEFILTLPKSDASNDRKTDSLGS